MTDDSAATQGSSRQQSSFAKTKAMLAYGVIQMSATVLSAISLAAIALSFCAIRQESKAFTGCVEEVISEGRSQARAVRYCNGGKISKTQ